MAKLAGLLFATAWTSLLLVGSASADCTCRARGMVAKHGQTMCLRTPEGPRLARCDKVLNVASWTFLPVPCPLAAPPPRYWLALSD